MKQLLLLWVLLVASTNGQDNRCEQLQASDLGSTDSLSNTGLLARTIGSTAGESSNPPIRILQVNTVCLGQSQVRDSYRSTSVVVSYMRDGAQVTAQVEYQCDSSGMWSFGSDPVVDTSPVATLATPTTANCILCIDPVALAEASVIEHCAACRLCSEGLMRCHGLLTAQTCCNYFDFTNTCVEECPINSRPNSVTNECECNPGYMLNDTTISCMEIDECDPNPCQNGGNCTDMINAFSCACPLGYTGNTCDAMTNECEPNPCLNGGTCVDLTANFSCSCPPTRIGATCMDLVTECNSDTCQNGGTCTEMDNSVSCACISGFTGEDCGVNIDDCTSNPCPDGYSCMDLVNDFSCNCTDCSTTTTETTAIAKTPNDNTTYIIIGVVLALIVVLAVVVLSIIIGSVYFSKKPEKNKPAVDEANISYKKSDEKVALP